MKRPGDEPGLCCLSFLLLTFRMGLFTMLASRLRVLLGACGVFLPLGMIALAVMFSGGSMGLGRVFVMFCCFVVFVSSHFAILGVWLPALRPQTAAHGIVPFCAAMPDLAFAQRLVIQFLDWPEHGPRIWNFPYLYIGCSARGARFKKGNRDVVA